MMLSHSRLQTSNDGQFSTNEWQYGISGIWQQQVFLILVLYYLPSCNPSIVLSP